MDMHKLVTSAFKQTFFESHNTLLVGGREEPFYQAHRETEPALICYREDYVSSALHEIAHWCIAGPARRLIDDYGYWYEPDGRNTAQQQEFELVEVKPQALEWIFSKSIGLTFRISADNLVSNDLPSIEFSQHVYTQVQTYLTEKMPTRAKAFVNAIADSTSHASWALDPNSYQIDELAL